MTVNACMCSFSVTAGCSYRLSRIIKYDSGKVSDRQVRKMFLYFTDERVQILSSSAPASGER